MHYPVLGLLSFLENGVQEFDRIKEIHTQLNQNKRFKWNKDINLILAINFLMSEKIDNSSLIGTQYVYHHRIDYSGTASSHDCYGD